MQNKTLQRKRALRTALFVLLLSVAGTMKMYAQNFTVGDLNYSVNDDGVSVTVTGHIDGTVATGSLVIPESVNYQGTTYSVTMIGVSAFIGCNGLTSLVLPSSVIEIDHHAFAFCSGFTGDLVLPNSLITIGWSAFAYCSSLNSLTLPYSVTTIDDFAFSGCSGWTSFTIPNSVTSIGKNPFTYCSGLEQIVVESGNLVYDSRNNCNAIIKTGTNELISGCMNSTIPNSVSAIGNNAFAGCYGLTSLNLPNSVTTIGEESFWDCNGLTSLIFPNSVTTIGERAFYYCNGLTSIISLATTPPVLRDEVFSGILCTALTVPCGCVLAYEVSDWHNYFTTIIDDCTGLLEDDESVVTVFPNPTNGKVAIEAENLKHITISNLLGQIVFDGNACGSDFEYDFSKHDAGIYLIRIETANGVAVKKVSVTR